jgi:plastocyanin
MRKVIVLTALLLTAVSCGDDETEPTPNPNDTTITITGAGVNPKNVTINAGGRIIWQNSDSVQHHPSSNPHPAHTDCPGLGPSSALSPGQSATSAVLNTRGTCGFHDHLADTNTNLQGTVTIQ